MLLSLDEESSLAGRKGIVLQSRLSSITEYDHSDSYVDGVCDGNDDDDDDYDALTDEFNQNTSLRQLFVGSYIH